MQEAVNEAGIDVELQVVDDGVKALKYLRRQGRFADKPPASMVLLDLNLPRKDGREVLVEMKSDRKLACIPVIVLSTSASEDDVRFAYAHHANCYICKPLDLDEFLAVVDAIRDFWLTVVRLPG